MTHKIEKATRMRDGTVAEDPRLGRLQQFDDRSREYDVRDTLRAIGAVDEGLKTKSWVNAIYLDQGNTSACTGMSRTYDLAGQPGVVKTRGGQKLNSTFAQALYHLAQHFDEWEGQDYEGSSVLGALKACAALGLVGEYRWAFNMNDMCLALSHLGPVVVGTTWYNSMFDPRPSGLLEVDVSSGDAGGHAYCFRRILVSQSAKRAFLGKGETIRSEPLLVVRNSWSEDWGRRGEAGMWADDYQDNLYDGGEQSVVTKAIRPEFN